MTSNLLFREGCLPQALNSGLFISSNVGRHPRRTIDSFEIIFMRSGRLIMQERGNVFTLQSGETLLLFPDREHAGLSDYERDTSFYWIHFRFDASRVLVRDDTIALPGYLAVPQAARPEQPERLVELFRQFLHGQEEGFACPMEADLLIAQMLVELACHCRSSGESKTAQRLAEQVKKIVSAEFHDHTLSPGEVANRLEVNSDYLGRVFKSVTKTSIGQYLIDRRLREARKLLQESDLNVNQIALASGFTDPGYFRRLFRKHFDMKPADFRKLYFRAHINVR